MSDQMTPKSAAEQAEEYALKKSHHGEMQSAHRESWLAGHAAGRAEARELAEAVQAFIDSWGDTGQCSLEIALLNFKAAQGE